jgi:DNA-binding transcriptional MerR regulator
VGAGVSVETAEPALPIGQLAGQLGVSTRTLRYYEELGLLHPSGRSPGGARRYSEADAERLARVRELQEVMGFNLDEIRAILTAEDRLDALRVEFERGVRRDRHRQMLEEAMAINDQLREQVLAKRARLDGFLHHLDEKAARYQKVAKELAG